ncbi:helix-turn-helix transcriptional regulator [Pseudonocardia sp. MH-G8]|uniref:ArsR/SmtB family transcription factor n=1 Tax=Pseudonocardia sp. MH-G8 TaxID=1854588 RepID=UPI000BA0A0A2|nr:winged helix-turn-helix domain-containing protein [Pseudonocardia sp. MH-G8]OZM81512.1 transcriptional regulator [Pseudonocardia sp. MH-G8]
MTAVALAELAALLADRTRARFCVALLDGRAWTASELAGVAGVAPSTASEHLGRLVAGGLLVERRQGRHRYVQLASPQVAQLVEDMAAFATPAQAAPVGLRAVRAAAALAEARTCYDHLAGRLGVAITDSLGARGLLDRAGGFALTSTGLDWFATELGFVPARSRRPVARPCLDWTERRSHLAGQAGAHLCAQLERNGWITRREGDRAVRRTAAGETALHDLLGV